MNPTNPITYCTNIHPGDGWERIRSNLQTYIPQVKKAVSPDRSFPVGLWLSNRSALEIDEKEARRLGEWCRREGCHVASINAFPYGSFHEGSVKYNVYLPDWRQPQRAAYTKRLGLLLDSWLPADGSASISTLPVGFKGGVKPGDFEIVRHNLLDVLYYFLRLRSKSGKRIVLALEPEPGCVLETTAEAISFFERMQLPPELKTCLGVCFDCCHQAVGFENAAESLSGLIQAGIPVPKIQVSSALRLRPADRATLEKFVEPTYLHQVVVRDRNGTLNRYPDLPDALSRHPEDAADEWRIHFHVPVFIEKAGHHETTRYFAEEVIALADPHILLEIETYTWHVLPLEMQTSSVVESIIREIRWVKSKADEKNRCSQYRRSDPIASQ